MIGEKVSELVKISVFSITKLPHKRRVVKIGSVNNTGQEKFFLDV